MKVLFAINSDKISDAIIKEYQKDYKEIISYKNVYYFNAILKELQNNKTYDRIVINEDLEPFANNNYDTIDKFIFEKLDKISDEATKANGEDIDIILVTFDRRNKSDEILSKFFGIGVYNAILGQDRSIDTICKLINQPRTKKESKLYYKIETNSIGYQSENENSVSEAEVQNILAHYKRLGKNEDKYVDSFNNIVSQYTDTQLKIIVKYLPIQVKAVLEEKSPKYQELITFSKEKVNQYEQKVGKRRADAKKEETIKVKMLNDESDKVKMKRPIVIPSGINSTYVKKIKEENIKDDTKGETILEDLEEDVDEIEDIVNEENIQKLNESSKRGRGRPRKDPETIQEDKPKRRRGRPKKVKIEEDLLDEITPKKSENMNIKKKETEEGLNLFESDEEDLDLFELDEENKDEEDLNLFELDEENKDEEDLNLFELDEENKDEEDLNLFELNNNQEEIYNNSNLNRKAEESDNKITATNQIYTSNNLNTLLTQDKKIVSFVGTTKNGTSFVVNNLAEMLSSMGISTAILDMTKSKNAYYIYTNNEEILRRIAIDSIDNLQKGINQGIEVNKNLTVYTSLPSEEKIYNNIESMLSTLVHKHDIVLIDCDFDTQIEIFQRAQEIYLVQSMDVLTIQPLTAFLRNLKSRNILKQEKIRVVINKEQRLKSLSARILIGGISAYNDPSMSFMTELFNKEEVKFCKIPFETQNYVKYLEALVNCEINLNGYTKQFMSALQELCNLVYPLISKKSFSPIGNKNPINPFSSKTNDTLNRMKKNY